MAKRYYQAAGKQLNGAYNQQVSAAQSQIPAIQQLYATLMQGLQGQQQAGNQNILEGAGARGLLRSTIPVDAQVGLGQQILQQQGQYGLQQQQDLGAIYGNIAGIRTEQAGSVANLANQLQQTALQQEQFGFTKKQAKKSNQLALLAAKRGY